MPGNLPPPQPASPGEVVPDKPLGNGIMRMIADLLRGGDQRNMDAVDQMQTGAPPPQQNPPPGY